MLYKKEESFAKDFKAKGLAGAYLLYGGEHYLVDAWRERLVKPFSGDSFNLHKLDGRSPDIDALYDCVEALPLMAAQKCVWLEDLDTSKLGAVDLEKLEEILGDLPEDCVLVITGKGAFDGRSANAKKLVKLADAAGSVVELGGRDSGSLVTFLKNTAKKQGCELSTAMARKILETCETDMNTLSREMAKVCAYAGEGEILAAHVEAVAILRTEARIFDLGKAILAGNPQRAMEILDDLFFLREQPVTILAILTMSYVDLYRARAARDAGVNVQEMAAHFPAYKGKEFRLRNAFSSRLDAAQLRRCLEALLDCDRSLKSTGVDGRVLLEQTVTKLLMLGAR